MIDKETAQRIKDAARIEEVVGDFVTLKRRGASLWGLCPFHNEKTPSFCVTPAKNLCKCFGCGEGGGPVNFLMKLEKYTYEEALRYLAKKYNIEIVERQLTQEELERKSARENMLAVNTYAMNFFVNNLYNTDEGQNIGMAYLRERGFRDDIIKKFKLGYSLSKYDALCSAALKDRHSRQALINTGLAKDNQRGGLTDIFRERIIFPVFSVSGQVIAFSGRILVKNDNVGKYVNSPESEVYHKGNELYGLYQAKSAIQKNDLCYLVEGNADVVTMHQAGIENTVASLGTAFTVQQIKQIHRLTNNVVVLYDGDAAGRKAAIKAIDMLLEEGMNVEAALWPEGEDPDSFARSHDSSEVVEYINSHKEKGVFFKNSIVMNATEGDPDKITDAISTTAATISRIPDNIARAIYTKKMADEYGIAEKLLIQKVDEMVKAKAVEDARELPKEKAVESTEPKPFAYKEERQLIRYILRYGNDNIEINSNGEMVQIPVLDYIAGSLEADNIPMKYPIHTQILEEALNCESDLRTHFSDHPDATIQKYAFSLLEDKYEKSALFATHENSEETITRLSGEVQTIMFEYRFAIVKEEIAQVTENLKTADKADTGAAKALFTRLSELNKQKQQIATMLGDRT